MEVSGGVWPDLSVSGARNCWANSQSQPIVAARHGIADGAPELAAGDTSRFQNAVALRLKPPRPSTGTKAETPAPEPKTEEPPDTRSAMQKLIDKFR